MIDTDAGYAAFEQHCIENNLSETHSDSVVIIQNPFTGEYEDYYYDTGYYRAISAWYPATHQAHGHNAITFRDWPEIVMKWTARQTLRSYVRQLNHMLYNDYYGMLYDYANNVGGTIDRTDDYSLGRGVRASNGIRIGLDEYQFDADNNLIMEFDSIVVNTDDEDYLVYVASGLLDDLPVFAYGTHAVGDLVRSGRVEAIIEMPVNTRETVGTSIPGGTVNFTLPSLNYYNGQQYPLFRFYSEFDEDKQEIAYYYRMEHPHYFMEDDHQYRLPEDWPAPTYAAWGGIDSIIEDTANSIRPFVAALQDLIENDFKNYMLGWGSSPYSVAGGTANWSELYVPDPTTIYKHGHVESIDGFSVVLSGVNPDNTDVNRGLMIDSIMYTITSVTSNSFVLDGIPTSSGIASVLDRKYIFIPGIWDNNIVFSSLLGAFGSSAPFKTIPTLIGPLLSYWDNSWADLFALGVYKGMVAIWDNLRDTVMLEQLQGMHARAMCFEGGGIVGSFDGLQLT